MEAVPRLPMLNFELKESPENADFATKIKQYIGEHYHENPDNYASEIQELEGLRASAIRAPRDFTGCSTLKKYYCQLHFLLSRFPLVENPSIAVSFSWCDIYSSMVYNVSDIKYEMACVLYNIGALHTELGAMDQRNTPDGMKISCTHFQCSAWAFQNLRDTYSQPRESDLSPTLMTFMYNVALAQAQECILEKSMTDNRKPTIIAKVAMQVVEYLRTAMKNLAHGKAQDAAVTDIVGSRQFKTWQRYCEFKQAYHLAVALLYQGMQAEEQQKMGERLAYYQAAVEKLAEAAKMGKNLDNKDQISETITFANDVMAGKLTGAQKENEFVYHEKVPPVASLAEVKGASLVKGIPFSVKDPEVAGQDIFVKLVPMEAHQASSMYSEEKAKLLRQICSRIHDKNQELESYLASMQLDDITTLQTDDQLPQEIVECCADLNAHNGVKQLKDIMGKISNSYHDINTALNTLMGIMEEEESKESEFKVVLGKRGAPPNMIVGELKREASKYREAHKSAQDNNQALHRAITQHMPNLNTLAQPLDQIAQTIPSPATVEAGGDVGAKAEVQKLMGKVGEMKSQRELLEQQLRTDLQNDDITKQLVTEQDEMDDFFKEQLNKHDHKIAMLEQNMTAQNNILQALSEANAAYASTRRLTNQTQMQRTEMITSLLASYGAYQNIIKKAETAQEFYAKLESQVNKLLARVKSVCRVHEEEREEQLSSNVKKLTGGVNKGGIGSPGSPYIPPAASSRSDSSSSTGPKLKDFLAHMKEGGGLSGGMSMGGVPPTCLSGPQMIPGVPTYSYNEVAGAYTNSSSAYANPGSTYSSSIRPAPLGSEQTEGLTSNNSIGGVVNSHGGAMASYGAAAVAASAFPPSAPSPAPSPAPHSSPYKSANMSPYHSQGHYPQPASSSAAATTAASAVPYTTSGNAVPGYGQQPSAQHASSYHYPQQYYSAYGSYPPGASTGGSGAVVQQAPGSSGIASAAGTGAAGGYGYGARIPTTGIYSGATSAVAGSDTSSSNTSVAAAGSAQPLVSSNTNTQQYTQYSNKPGQYQYYGQQHPAPTGAAPSVPGATTATLPPGSTTAAAAGATSATGAAAGASSPYIGSSNQVNSSYPYQSYQYPQGQYSMGNSSQPSATSGTQATAGGQQAYTGQTGTAHVPQTYTGQTTVHQTNASQVAAAGYNYYPSAYNGNTNTSISNNTASTSMAATTVSNSNVTAMYPASGSRQWSNYPGYGQYGVTPATSTTTTGASSYGQYGVTTTQYGGATSAHTAATTISTTTTYSSSGYGQYPYTSATSGPSSTSTYTTGGYSNGPGGPYAGGQSTQQQQYWNQYGNYNQTTHSVQQQQQQQQPHQQQPGHPAQPMTYPTQPPSSFQAQQPSTLSQQIPHQTSCAVPGGSTALPGSANPAATVAQPTAAAGSNTSGQTIGGNNKQQQSRGGGRGGGGGGSVASITSGISNLDLLSGIELTTPNAGSQWSPLTPQPVVRGGAGSMTGASMVPDKANSSAATPPDVTSAAASSNLSSNITNLPNVVSTTGSISNNDATSSDGDNVSSIISCSSSSSVSTISTAAILDLAKKATPRIAVDPLSDDVTLKSMAEETERLSRYVEGLSKQPIDGSSNLETKWREISEMLDKECGSLKVSVGRCYPLKNRFADILPFDHTRVLLPSKRDDYINASHVKMLSVSESMAMVVTQAPLPSTMVNFWALVWEQQIELIVTLHSDAEVKGQVHWPSESGSQLDFGQISVSLHNVVESQGSGRPSGSCWSKRVFHISHQQTKINRVVIQIQFLGWPPSSMPDSPGPLLQFLCEVHSLHQQQRNKLRAVLVHCVPGIGRSGVFAILSALVKQIHTNGELGDISALVLELSRQRRGGIQDKDHLHFLYSALLYYAQDILMKRGILTNKATFEEGPREKTHVRHPSADLLNAYDFSRLKSKLGLDESSSESPSRSHSLNSLNSKGSGSDERKTEEDASNKVNGNATSTHNVITQHDEIDSMASDDLESKQNGISEPQNINRCLIVDPNALAALSPSLAASLDPHQFKLDPPSLPKPVKITKEHFENPTKTLEERKSDTNDPFSGLDPLWSHKKV